MTTLWEAVKEQIKTKLPKNSFSLWIEPVTFLEEKHNSIVLGCPNKFSMKWITENYMALIEKELRKVGENQFKIALRVSPPAKASFPTFEAESRQLLLPNIPRPPKRGLNVLNHDFTFERFVVGKCNEFAYSASRAMAFEPNPSYPCLFILANTGLGKSHLSQATGHAILKSDPRLRVYYITAEDFVNEMIFALRNHKIDEFKNKYRRSCDVLLLEEVHFLGGKEKTQLELGYTLDSLINDHKKVIFTSSLLPKDIPNLKKELASRLTSGIITTLQKPDYETRVRILEQKSREQSLNLPEEILHLLAKNLQADIRQMESALRCLKAKSELMKVKIDLDLAREVLKCHVPLEKPTTIKDVEKLVCQYFKVDPESLRSKSRKKIHAYPRNVYAYLCRKHTDKTLEEIGKSLNRNHSTVLYGLEVIERKIKTDGRIKKEVDFLDQKLKKMRR